jgi:hypothetical protein
MTANRPPYLSYALAPPGHDLPDDLTPVLRQLMEAYQEDRGRLPAGVVVNTTKVSTIQDAFRTLGLSVEVSACGGCLAWGMWLVPATAQDATCRHPATSGQPGR